MRHPGNQWNAHPPHIDGMSQLHWLTSTHGSSTGGSLERWQDPAFRKCFADILSGDWREHDPYDLVNRINARTSLYGRPNQVILHVLRCTGQSLTGALVYDLQNLSRLACH